jgi:hypothetical protein
VPSGLIATPVTALVWPVRMLRWAPAAASQIRTVLSLLVVASQVPAAPGLIPGEAEDSDASDEPKRTAGLIAGEPPD